MQGNATITDSSVRTGLPTSTNAAEVTWEAAWEVIWEAAWEVTCEAA